MAPRDEQNMVYGVNAVIEALRAGKRQVESVTILQSARPDRLKAVLDLARENGVPVHRVPRLDLDRSLGEARHQGVVARIAAAHYADADQLLDTLAAKVGTPDPPCRSVWTASRIRATWVRSCAPLSVPEFTACSLPSAVRWG
jgi:tRNA G18 (ribose-2'-O)-methylase SpoU